MQIITIEEFPAPREVDRELYTIEIRVKRYKAPVFPTPLEVDR